MLNNEQMNENTRIEIDVIDLDGKRYFLVDTLAGEKNFYYYFSNLEDNKDIKLLKVEKEGEEEFFVSIDDAAEIDYAFSLFYEKYKEFDMNS